MLIDILVIVIIGIVAYWVITKFFPAPFTTVALAIVGIILLLALLNVFGLLGDSLSNSRLVR